MLRTSLRSVWARKVRLLMSTFAIVLGVAFVAGSLIFTDALDKAFSGIMNGTVSDVVVRPEQTTHRAATSETEYLSPAVLEKVRRTPGVRQADGVVQTYTASVVGKNGKVIGGQGAPAFGVNFHDAPAAGGVPGLHVTEGRAPRSYGEVALDPETAQRGGYHIGDSVPVLTTGDPPRYVAKLVGLASYANGSMVGSTLAVVDTATAQRLFLGGNRGYSTLWVATAEGTSQSQLAERIRPVVPAGFEAVTGKQASDEAASRIKKALRFVTAFLLVFAGVALLVGSFLIVNTFGILVAQRSRELALMRALGASRRQVLGSVLVEALAVGLMGSAIGLGLGVLLAEGISALLGRFGADVDTGSLTLEPRSIITSFVVGVGVTLLAAWLPARRASRVAPVAAMRDDQVESERSVVMRGVLGAVLAVLGVVVAAIQLRSDGPIGWAIAGMVLVLLGVIAATPVLARPVVRVLGGVTRPRLGVVATLAEENALRNPRRTAATSSALMIGLTLVTMMTVFGASASSSVDALIKRTFRGDFVVSGTFGAPMSPAIAQAVERTAGVGSITRVRTSNGSVNGARTTVQGVDPASFRTVTPLTMTAGSQRVDGATSVIDTATARSLHLRVGSTVDVSVDGVHRHKVTVAGIFDKEEGDQVADVAVSMSSFTAMGGSHQDNTIYVLNKPGAKSADVQAGLVEATKQLPTVTVKDQAGYAAEQRQPIERLLVLIYGLLGLAIVIAVLGIINTLALSVIERTREIGLLRAVGLSRRQLRSMIRLEAVTISLLGAVIGVALGVVCGLDFQRTQANSGVDVLVIPWGRLVVFLLLAAVVGVLAAWWPARRATKLDILKAMSRE